ncbi:MAG: lipoate--protein ligase family protein [Planctomycetes bacterium]|nr:lipoate--protein ligase family protein [Planctomycetota bacterium]
MPRLLPTTCGDGPEQMSCDEALLTAATVPTLRLYRWDPATVSLGCFQEWPAIARTLPPSMRPGGTVVRRITGGGAIWHEHEVTYALVGRLGHDGFPSQARDLYPLLHAAVAHRLRLHGSQPQRQDQAAGDRHYREEPRCFASPAIDDLVADGGGKLLGSAARARGERVLIHGSLKLASNPWDGATVSGCGLSWEDAAAALRDGIAEALGARLESGEWTAAEIAARDAIRNARYSDERWVTERIGPRP